MKILLEGLRNNSRGLREGAVTSFSVTNEIPFYGGSSGGSWNRERSVALGVYLESFCEVALGIA